MSSVDVIPVDLVVIPSEPAVILSEAKALLCRTDYQARRVGPSVALLPQGDSVVASLSQNDSVVRLPQDDRR